MSRVISLPAQGAVVGEAWPQVDDVSPAAHRSALRQERADGHPRTSRPAAPTPEPRDERLRRGGRQTAFYVRAAAIVGLLAVLIAIIAANTRQVQLDWLVGSAQASLVWITFFTVLIGWLLGIATSALFRQRTRRRQA